MPRAAKKPKPLSQPVEAGDSAPRLATRRVRLDQLRADPRNPRTHGAEQVEAICRSLTQFGQVEPLVVQAGTGRLIGGHGRLEAMLRLGWVNADVVDVQVDDRAAAALNLALNRTGDLAGYDNDLLAALLANVGEGPPELLAATGFDEAEVERLQRAAAGEAEQDEVPEVPVKAVSRVGDLWVLGRSRLVCGDSTDQATVTRLLGGAMPFMMVTDPPYGVAYDPEWRKESGLDDSDHMGKVTNDHLVDWSAALKLFPGDVAYVWHAAWSAADTMLSMRGVGFDVRSQVIWAKPALQISRGHYHWQHEPCWYAVRKGKTSRWCGDRSQSTVWQISNRIAEHTEHSTEKPVECMARPIRNHDATGGGVYDPFVGSGTTLIACEQLERPCFAVELEPRYCDVALMRWQKLTGRDATLDGRTFAQVAEERASSE